MGSAGRVSVADAPTRVLQTADADLVYRQVGEQHSGDVPLVALTHLGANLDSWDPELVDPLAENRRVILLGYRGVGASTRTVADSFEAMADDVAAALGIWGSLGWTCSDCRWVARWPKPC